MKLVILVMSLPVVCAAASISSISVCATTPPRTGPAPMGWDQGSCPTGEFDTHFMVLGPGGTIAKPVSINAPPYKGGLGMQAASDEHASVFAPGLLGGNPSDYLFFVASGIYDTTVKERIDVATMVLSGGSGPLTPYPGTGVGVWQFNYPSHGYGHYSNGQGAVFRAPMVQRHSVCPFDLFPPLEFGILDNTFDLKYAAPGSVIPDPTVAGNFLMIYEGTNTCLGPAGITIGVATSVPSGTNYAEVWPSYCGAPNAQCPDESRFSFAVLPDADNRLETANGPFQATGAWGREVCVGNTCNAHQYPPSNYGRYAVLQDPGYPQCRNGEPSAFLDDVNPAARTYIYVVYTLATCDGAAPDLRVAQSQVMAGQRLSFTKWNGGFNSAGMGGADTSFLPAKSTALRGSCGAPAQTRTEGSISYIEDTQQYLLLFVCTSPDDPEELPCNMNPSNCSAGHSWFWATNIAGTDLSTQKWNPPVEVQGSFQPGSSAYKGLYPTLMSLGAKPGHVKNIASVGSTYAFYMFGCNGKCSAAVGREYSSRVLTLTLK